MSSVLRGQSRQEFATSDHTATYKSNSSWTFSSTEAYANNGYFDSEENSGEGYDEEGDDTDSSSQGYGNYTGGNGVSFNDTAGGGNTSTGSGTTGNTGTGNGAGSATGGGTGTGGDTPTGGDGNGGGTTTDPGNGAE